MSGDMWPCEAYGSEGAEVGALCFMAGEIGARVCADAAECGARLVVERRELFDRLTTLAEADPTYAIVAEGVTSPEQLLGGPRSHELLGDQADGEGQP